MKGRRQNKITRLLQKELADIFLKLGKNYAPGTIVTVTLVRISGDLSVAKVYISFYPPNTRSNLLKNIQQNKGFIRFELGKRIRKQLRKVPELIFILDDSYDFVEKIDNLLK